MDLEVRQQRESEGHRQRTVCLVRGLADAELVGEAKPLVAQKGKARAEAAAKSLLHPRRVDRDRDDAAVGDLSRLVELDQLPQLQLSLRSPRPSIEGQNQRMAVSDLCDGNLAAPIAGQGKRRKGVANIET